MQQPLGNAASISSHPVLLLPSTSQSPAERKRHAPTDCDSLAKRPRPSPALAPSPPVSPVSSESLASRAPPQLPSPEQASINAILRHHCRTKLFVRPIFWTSQHLQLLDCRFETRNIPQGPRSWDLEGHADPQKARQIVNCLSGILRPSVPLTWRGFIKDVLDAHGLVRSPYDKLQFHFGRRSVSQVRTDGVFSPTPGLPCLAFFHLDSIKTLRHNGIHWPILGRFDEPTSRLRRKRERLLQPPSNLEDPYMAATIIALAQEHRRSAGLAPGAAKASCSSSEGPDASITACLLVLTEAAPRKLFFYTARVPLSFLDKFDEPGHFSPTSPLLIEYYRIPILHPEKAADRLRRLLEGAGIHGHRPASSSDDNQ